MPESIFPRLQNHLEKQAAYHERQRQKSEQELAKLCLVYSGQLEIDFDAPPPPNWERDTNEGQAYRQFTNHFKQEVEQ